MNQLTAQQVKERLLAAIKKAGTQKAFAAKCKVSQAYICDMVNDKRPIIGAVLKKLGVRKETTYWEITQNEK